MKPFALAAALAVLVQPALAADKVTLLLDWFVNPDHAPIIIAREKGFFADAGLEVDVVAPADPADPPKLVAAGKADYAISYQPQLHLQVHEGLPLKRVGTLIATPLNCLMVKADGPVQQIADLKGKKIGYSVSGVEDALVGQILKTAGLSMSDVQMVNVNWSLSPALIAGQVDATIGAYRNFELTQMRLEGAEGKCFFVEEQGVPTYDELIFVANPTRMDLDRTRRLLQAVERGAQYMVNHPEESWQLFSATAPDLSDELNAQAWKDTLPRFSQSPAALDQGRYARFEQFLKDARLIETALPVSDLAMDVGAP
ncbi:MULTISPECIES: ABC transporter substrate-binding protein [unclassified Paracoccus (in: a-proteobacteria)]|uniref:ABC transporter substrate-binding protein n=1 Tax=unclassified Paracoccus (in: a-proteobacteria) TaxID=2688777 RepID=UPI0012B2FEE0|nr:MULTISPECIES: ABC transporter substrate-binding protein [unclassified Paracoccus (in: a-proteobacteria)]UXU75716.1 ABC transporter substrate-binding protein [Paracoccus sp. SMMA_5]UXU81622.1 ABC transporter substrate-binding protein [Paracoccus sp. SMMA_5_TC]